MEIITLTKQGPANSQAATGRRGEITPQMRQAGACVIRDLSDVVDAELLADRVYTAMAALSDQR